MTIQIYRNEKTGRMRENRQLLRGFHKAPEACMFKEIFRIHLSAGAPPVTREYIGTHERGKGL